MIALLLYLVVASGLARADLTEQAEAPGFERCGDKTGGSGSEVGPTSGTGENRHLSLTLLPGGIRCEATVATPRRYPEGETVTFSVEFQIPDGSVMDVDSMVILQFKAENALSPPFAFRLKRGAAEVFPPVYGVAATVRYENRAPTPGNPALPLDRGAPNGHEVVLGRVNGIAANRWYRMEATVRAGADGMAQARIVDTTDNTRFEFPPYAGPLGYVGLPNYLKFGPYDASKGQMHAFKIKYKGYEWSLK